MAKRSRQQESEDDEETSPTSRGPQPPRISITLPSRVRRKVRIAAAKSDMEINDWCKAVLVKAAQMTLDRLGLD
jgi:hypothetical protein